MQINLSTSIINAKNTIKSYFIYYLCGQYNNKKHFIKMRLKHLFAAVLLLLAAGPQTLTAQNPMQLAADTAVVTGKLPNGLTYYVRHNNWPEHRVNFYIAQRVGSIQENDDQQGLAHFLEHMAFNGSDNFPENSMIEYLRSIGVEFGSDLNAYTGVDQTVYRICNVPSDRMEPLDSCLLVLKDWSNGLTLDAKEIDKERGVIHDEWRQRTSAMMRVLYRQLPALFPGSKYGLRLPIGKMEVVDNFKPDALRKYYQKWYRPDNQAIIVVGDVDVNRTVAKIKELFSGIKMPASPAKVVDEAVPDNNEAIVIVEKDKEQKNDFCMLLFKHDAFPDSLKNSFGYILRQYAVGMGVSMLNSRLSEISQNADCPFLGAYADDADYIIAKTKAAFSLDVAPKPQMTEKAVSAALREAIRAARFGFTETEFARAKANYLSSLETAYTNRNKRDNSVFGDACRDNFLSNEPLFSIEDTYTTMKAVVPQIPLDVINKAMAQLVSLSDTNLVVLSLHTEKEGAAYPTTESLKKAIDSVHSEQLAAWVDNVKNEPLMKTLPAKGKILKEKDSKKFGYKTLTLSNGAKVILKKTDYKESEVRLKAVSKGGMSLYGEKDLANLKVFSSAIEASGLGEFSYTELIKALAGKQVGATLSLTGLNDVVSGSSTPNDMESMFQLVHLYFTDIRKDEKNYNALMTMLATDLKNRDLSPDIAFSDSLRATFTNHNPHSAPLTLDMLKDVSYDRIMQIAKERTANAADFTFYIIGNFNEDSIRPMIEQYIASLPAKGPKENWKTVSTYAKGNVENNFTRKMETPNAKVFMTWYKTGVPYSLENGLLADVAGQVLQMVYLKRIREAESVSYSPQAGGSFSPDTDVPIAQVMGMCPMNPDKADKAVAIMNEEIKNLSEKVDPDMLKKIQELLVKRIDESVKSNGYWLGVINTYDEFGIDLHTDYKKLVNGLTPEKVARFVKDNILKNGNSVKVLMMPAEK